MRAFLMAGLLAVATVSAAPAHAAFTVCNKASSPINVAIAFETPQDVVSQGWWIIQPNACEAVIPSALTQRSIYHYAMSTALNIEWAGAYNFCTQSSPQFRIAGSMDCEARNFKTTGFRQTDLQGQTDYTLDIIGPAPTTTPQPTAATTTPEVTISTPEVTVPDTQAASQTTSQTPAATAPAVVTPPAATSPAATTTVVTPTVVMPPVATLPAVTTTVVTPTVVTPHAVATPKAAH